MTTEVLPLTEHVDSRGLTITAAPGLLRGVKLLGTESANKNRYPAPVLSRAVALYEGVKVNVNHPDRHAVTGPRDYRDRLGRIVNVQARTDGLYGDLQFNPHHPLAGQLLWDARHAPENVGLSHNAEGRGRRDQGWFVVDEITSVRSVDLVADPASTRGLFEGQATRLPDAVDTQPAATAAALAALEQRLAVLESRLAEAEDRRQVDDLITASGLTPGDVTGAFREALIEARDPGRRRELLADRRQALGRQTRPVSRDPWSGQAGPLPTTAWVAALVGPGSLG